MDFEGFVDFIIDKATDFGIEAFRNSMHTEAQISKLRKEVQDQLSLEKKTINENSLEGAFAFGVLSKHLEDYLLQENTVDGLLSEDKSSRERMCYVIIQLSIQESKPENKSAEESVKHIATACIQRIYSFFEKELSLETKYERMTTVRATTNFTDERISQAEKLFAEGFNRIDCDIKEIGRKIDSNLALQCKSDNKAYLELFNKKLFLDEDCEKVTLKAMYVEPGLIGEQLLARTFIQQWYQETEACMLLYGDAGIGKSSLVSKLVSDECQTEENKNDPNKAIVLAITLRDHCDEIKEGMNKKDPIKEIFKRIFNVEDLAELNGRVLILDGYDELTVLIDGFKEKASAYIKSICTKCRDYHFNVLITSREGYFEKTDEPNLIHEKLYWDEGQVDEWCRKYKDCKPEMSDDIDRFYSQYKQLPKGSCYDERFSVLCVPFILYLCCNSGVDLNKNSSVVKIYNNAFRKLLLREHSKGLRGMDLFDYTDSQDSLSDEQLRQVFWQYTKEIAYQMFLLNTLNLSNSGNPDSKECKGLVNAKKRTISILSERGISISEKDLQTTQYLSVFTFSKPDNTGGIAFVHKTVYDFFTAVKLYEDYFAGINDCSMQGMSEEEKINKLLNNTVEAFRYHEMPKDTMGYLCEMNEQRFWDDEAFSFSTYKELFIELAGKLSFARIGIAPALPEYQYPINPDFIEPLSRQLNQAFCSAICFLTGHGFRNDDINEEIKEKFVKLMKELCAKSMQFVDLHEWNLAGADFNNIHLERAELMNIHLENASLRESFLNNSLLQGAHLEWALMERANLEDAYLDEARLDHAHLERSNLRCTNFESAWLPHADLSRAIIERTKMNQAHLENANLGSCYLERSDFDFAHLEKADFTFSYLIYASFEYAHMEEAIFKKAHFVDADLEGAHLEKAHLEGAIIQSADCQNASFTGAYYDEHTVFPKGFDPQQQGMVFVASGEELDS